MNKKKIKSFLKENWFLLLTVVYVLSPIDLFPELLTPIFGYADDASLLLFELLRRVFFNKKSPINDQEKKIMEQDSIDEGEIVSE
ncbi:DUF1232 domain-containing protein [Candidatus Dojkabacteria bacterium]|uniref:DUF1232 domain-containing protein n=1 Tax=Candidatus Dojkabacteria bacterium TaxID=2099670 RepID=A0A955L7S5_9BACT|nr:DUF1232 domain-containing protein [Candidatus Dojkabacteria bacterium]